jgi:hypothetical protein
VEIIKRDGIRSEYPSIVVAVNSMLVAVAVLPLSTSSPPPIIIPI